MDWNVLLSASVVAGITSVITLVLKEALFPRSLELWRERRTLAATYRRYRDPIVLSARELAIRLMEIHDLFPADFLDHRYWDAEDPFDVVNDTSSVHYRKYKLVSTVYRLCAFLGWIEVYRRDVVFLDAGRDGKSQRFDTCLYDLHKVLADGHMNCHTDWSTWTDRLLFREEQRAIGEAMIRGTGPERTVIGYGTFRKAIADHDALLVSAIRPALVFVSDAVKDGDFRKMRFREYTLQLIGLVRLLDEKRLLDEMRRWEADVTQRRGRPWMDLAPVAADPRVQRAMP
jgi:hypothetical protein